MRRKSNYRKCKSTCTYCHTKYNSPNNRKKLCKAFATTCSKCQWKNHFSSVCRQKKKVSVITGEQDDAQEVTEAEVSNIAFFFSLISPSSDGYGYASLPSSNEYLLPVVGSLKNGDYGPVTSLSLVHNTHDLVSDWIQTKPDKSHTLPVHFTVDGKGYAELTMQMPRFKSGNHPG